MVANTYNIGESNIPADRIEPRNDMFVQSSALYSKINKRSKTSPWVIIAPVVGVLMVGAAVLATPGHQSAVAPRHSAASGGMMTSASTPALTTPAASTPSAAVKTSARTTPTHAGATQPMLNVTTTAAPAARVQTRTVTHRATATRTAAPTRASTPAEAPSAYTGVTIPAPTVSAPAPVQTPPVQAPPVEAGPTPSTPAPADAGTPAAAAPAPSMPSTPPQG